MGETNEVRKERNHYIDVLKGIAIISVIFIHATFLDGSKLYVPNWFANLTLLFEVPIFFFLSGWSFSYSKDNKSYMKSLILTQIKYIVFILIVVITVDVINYIKMGALEIGVGEFIQLLFHAEIPIPLLTMVYQSLWFFRVYFIVCIIGAILLRLLNTKASQIVTFICLVLVFLSTFIFPDLGRLSLGMPYSYIFFYLFFFMLGNITKDKKINLLEAIIFILSIVCFLAIIKIITPINIFNLQGNKFPPNFIYLPWSLFGVVIVLYLKNFFLNCKENVLSKIGQNSIYIYFAQGVATSILLYVAPYIAIDWYFKVVVLFAMNLLLTGVITVILRLITEPIVKACKKFLNNKVYAQEETN